MLAVQDTLQNRSGSPCLPLAASSRLEPSRIQSNSLRWAAVWLVPGALRWFFIISSPVVWCCTSAEGVGGRGARYDKSSSRGTTVGCKGDHLAAGQCRESDNQQ
jgi:hypothetical protein